MHLCISWRPRTPQQMPGMPWVPQYAVLPRPRSYEALMPIPYFCNVFDNDIPSLSIRYHFNRSIADVPSAHRGLSRHPSPSSLPRASPRQKRGQEPAQDRGKTNGAHRLPSCGLSPPQHYCGPKPPTPWHPCAHRAAQRAAPDQSWDPSLRALPSTGLRLTQCFVSHLPLSPRLLL